MSENLICGVNERVLKSEIEQKKNQVDENSSKKIWWNTKQSKIKQQPHKQNIQIDIKNIEEKKPTTNKLF